MEKPYVVGIDIGGTNTVFGVVDARGTILYSGSIKTGKYADVNDYVAELAKGLKSVIDQAGGPDKIKGVGVGAPNGNFFNGCIEFAPNLPWKGKIPLAQLISEQIDGIPVALTNDANAAAYGEYVAGAAKGAKNAVCITLGTGVGAGIVIDGKIYSGSNFGGAEVGHTVISVDGPQCTCGRKGCFEVYSSATGLVRMTKEALAANPDSAMKDEERISARTAFNYMRAGDATAKQVVDDYIKYLAAGITNTINIFQPDILCIGGGVCNEGDPLLVPMKEIVKKEVYTRDSAKNTVDSIIRLIRMFMQ